MKKRRKNPAAPKNPRSAYLYYVAEQRPIMAKDKRNAKVRFDALPEPHAVSAAHFLVIVAGHSSRSPRSLVSLAGDGSKCQKWNEGYVDLVELVFTLHDRIAHSCFSLA